MTEEYVYNVMKRIMSLNDGVPEGARFTAVRDEILDDLKLCINSLVNSKKVRFNRTVNGELIFYKANK